MIKSIKTTSVQTRRKFDQTFKREAVQNWLNSGKSAEAVGEEWALMPISFTLGESWFPPALGGERRRPSRAQSPICKVNWKRPIVNCVTRASRSLF